MTSSRRHAAGLLLLAVFLCGSVSSAHARPAFARKYGLRCSACHDGRCLVTASTKVQRQRLSVDELLGRPDWQNPSYCRR